MPEEKKGLDNTTIALMIAVALFYDALQILLAFIFFRLARRHSCGFKFLPLV